MNVIRRFGYAAFVFALLFGTPGCQDSSPPDTGGEIPATVDMTPKSSEEAAAEQMETAQKP